MRFAAGMRIVKLKRFDEFASEGDTCDCPRARTKKGTCNDAHQCIGYDARPARITC